MKGFHLFAEHLEHPLVLLGAQVLGVVGFGLGGVDGLELFDLFARELAAMQRLNFLRRLDLLVGALERGLLLGGRGGRIRGLHRRGIRRGRCGDGGGELRGFIDLRRGRWDGLRRGGFGGLGLLDTLIFVVAGVAQLGVRLVRAGLRVVPGLLRGFLPGLLLLATHRVRARRIRQRSAGVRTCESDDLTQFSLVTMIGRIFYECDGLFLESFMWSSQK